MHAHGTSAVCVPSSRESEMPHMERLGKIVSRVKRQQAGLPSGAKTVTLRLLLW